MDKIAKALKKLSTKERAVVKTVILKLQNRQLQGMDLQKLKGHEDIYRIRKGNLRIIYRQTQEDIFLLAIERRSEKTYRNF